MTPLHTELFEEICQTKTRNGGVPRKYLLHLTWSNPGSVNDVLRDLVDNKYLDYDATNDTYKVHVDPARM